MEGATPEGGGDYRLLDYLSILRRRWVWVILPVLVFGAAVTSYALSQDDQYEATASVLVADTASQRALDPTSQNAGFLTRVLSNEILLAESSTVEELVEAELELLPDVEISPASDADALFFVATADDPDDAARDANTWAEMYVRAKRDEAVDNITAATTGLDNRLVDFSTERQDLLALLDVLERRIALVVDENAADPLQREANDLRSQLDLVDVKAAATAASLIDLELQADLSAVGEARIIQVARPPTTTSNIPLSQFLAIGLLLGLLAGFGLALLAETRDNTIKNAADVQAITDVPVLASVPLADRMEPDALAMAIDFDPEGRFADAYHKVRTSIEFASFENEFKSILVTSPNAFEGKTTTASNLALALRCGLRFGTLERRRRI